MAPHPPSLVWLFAFLRPHGARIVFVLVLSLAASGLSLVQPYLIKFLVDDGLIGHRLDRVALYCGLLLGAALVGTILGGINRWHYVSLSARVLFALREALFRHLQHLPPRFFARWTGGEILSRIDGDVAEIQRFAVDSLLAAINASIALAGACALMARLSPSLTLLAFATLPAQVLALRLLRPRTERLVKAVRERSAGITGFFIERLGCMKLIQAVGAGSRESARLTSLQNDFLDEQLRLEMTGYLGGALPGLLNGVAAAAVFFAGGWMTADGRLTVGALLALVAYLPRATGAATSLLGLYLAQKRARVSIERVAQLLAEQPAVREPASPMPLPSGARGAITLEGVRFAHEGAAAPVLDCADAVFPAGAKIGLLGPSGAGKSTLMDLLHRHYDPQDGRILLDGVDLRHLNLDALRRRVAVVAQDTMLMAGTLAENIRYAVPSATDAEVRRAAELAQVMAFAERLPLGLDTPVGERAAQLSGGQRQRLAIARAVLQDPLVLILDEATSAVDGDAERLIAEAIDRLFAGRTRIIVSHHRETLAGVDLAFAVAEGRLERQTSAEDAVA